MKAAAANDALTHPLDETEAVRLNRRLWGNSATTTIAKAKFNEITPKLKASLTKQSAIDIADECITTVRATIERAGRTKASRTKFDLLFEALSEIIVDVQRQMAPDKPRHPINIK